MRTSRKFEWSDWGWKSLEWLIENGPTEVYKKSGVYQIRWAKNNIARQVGRCKKPDKNGILYIGKHDGNLRRRLDEHSSILETYYNGVKIRGTFSHTYFAFGLWRRFKPKDLQARWGYTKAETKKGKTEALLTEECLLRSYLLDFSELPPMNLLTVKRSYHRTLPKKLGNPPSKKALQNLLACYYITKACISALISYGSWFSFLKFESKDSVIMPGTFPLPRSTASPYGSYPRPLQTQAPSGRSRVCTDNSPCV